MKKSSREKKRSVSHKPLFAYKIKSKIEDFFLSRRLSNENIFFSSKFSEISIDALRIHLPRTHNATTEKKRYAYSFSFILSVRPAARIGDKISLAHHHKCRFVFGELDTEENSHHQKRARCEKNTPMMRSVLLKRKKERAVEYTPEPWWP